MSTIIDPRILALLQQASWRPRRERFVLVGLEPNQRQVVARLLASITAPFVQLIFEPDMLTLLLPEAEWRSLKPAFPGAQVLAPCRVISFDLDLPDDLVGFLSVASQALAAVGVPILAICGYAKDHILVREQHLDLALTALQSLADG